MRRRFFALFLSACMVFETPISAHASNFESTAYENYETETVAVPETETGMEAAQETEEFGTEAVTEINMETTPESESESVTETEPETIIETEAETETEPETIIETEVETETETETVTEEPEPAVNSLGQTAYETATSSSQICQVNLGMGGISNPTAYSDSTPTWAGIRVRFGKGDENVYHYNTPSAIQLGSSSYGNNDVYKKGKTYTNIWRVLDADSGLLLADMPAVEAQSYGMAESGKWEDCGLYSYLNSTYKNGTNFSDNDRKAIKGAITIPSKEDYLKPSYGFSSDADTECMARDNRYYTDYTTEHSLDTFLRQDETNPDYSMLISGGSYNAQIKSIEIYQAYYTDSSNKYYFTPMLTLDTSKVFYNYYGSGAQKFYKTFTFDTADLSPNGSDSLFTLVMKTDDTGFEVANLPDTATKYSSVAFDVTGLVEGGAYNSISALLVQDGRIFAQGYVTKTDSSEMSCTTGTYELSIDKDIPDGTYTLYLFEEYVPTNYYDSTSYVSNIVETSLTVESPRITSAEVISQDYGSITISFETNSVRGGSYVQIFRSESEDGPYTLCDTKEFDFQMFGTSQRWTDTDVALSACANKTYYYKLVRSGEYVDQSSTVFTSAPVATNAGMGYGTPRKDGDYADCIGLALLDEENNIISAENSLTLHVGESKRFKMAFMMKDGTTQPFTKETKEAFDQFWRDQGATNSYMKYFWWSFWAKAGEESSYSEDNSYILCYPAVDFDTKWDIIIEAKKEMPAETECYLESSIGNTNAGDFKYRVPITIEPAEEGVVYENKCPIKIYDDREKFNQAIRDEWVNRTPEFTFYLTPKLAFEYQVDENGVEEEGSWCLEDALDFYEEREGMKPYEGDYIYWNMGSPGSPGVAIYEHCVWKYEDPDSEIGTTSYGSATFYSHFITTKEQENYVTRRMQEIVHTPGGELYDYLDASDYAKAKAAYDYVVNHVAYIGTYEGYWHTAYSALHDGKATCQGYALLYMRLCRELGLPCKLLADTTYKADSFTPDSISAHAWNLVKVGSKWYHVDTNARVFLAEKVSGSNNLQSCFNTRFKSYYLSGASKTPYGGAKTSALKAAVAMTDAQLTALDSGMTSTAARMKGTYSISGNTIKVTGTLKYMEGCTSHLGYDASEAGAADGYFLAVSLTADKASFDENGSVKITLIPGGQSEAKIFVLTKANPASEDGKIIWITDSTNKNNDNRINFLVKVGADTDTKLNVELDFDTDGDDSIYQAKTYAFDFSGLTYEEPAKSYVTVKEEAAYGVETSSPLITGNAASTVVKAEYDAVAWSSNVVLPEGAELVGDSNISGTFDNEGNYAILKAEAAASIRGTAHVKKENISVIETTAENGGAEGSALPSAYVVEEENTKKAACVYLVVPMTAGTDRTFTVSWGSARTQTITVCAKEGCILQSLSATAEPPKSLAFNGLQTTMYVGQSQNVSVTINKKYDMDSTQISFTSSNPEVLSVNRITGAITALNAGSANITVTAENGADTGTKKVFKSAKIVVKEVAAPGSVKVTGLQDKSLSVTWKANTTGQYTEVYIIPYDQNDAAVKAALGTNASQWKKNLEAACVEVGLNSADGWLAGCVKENEQKKAEALTQMQSKLCIPDSLGQIQAFVMDASVTEVPVEGLTAEKEYLIYVRNTAKSAVDTLSVAGANVVKVKTTKTVFASIVLQTLASDGTEVTAGQNENGIPLFVVTGDSLAAGGAPERLAYTLFDSERNALDTATTTAASVTFKTSNSNVIKVDNRKRMVSLGGQAGTALLTVTAKDAANQTKESAAVMIRVIKEPTALTKKTTTLALGQNVSIRDLIGTNIKGSAGEINLEQIDFESALAQLNATGCFTVSYKEGSAADESGNYPATDAILTANSFATDKSGRAKSGNTVIIPFTLKNESGEAISTQNATIKITDMTAPKVTKSTVRDTSAVLTFTPSNGVSECNGEAYYYTLELVDNVTKRAVDTIKITETGGTNICVYTVSDSPDSTDKKTLMLCELEGLSPNKSYSAYITAHYIVPDTDKYYEKKSPVRQFTTLKPLMTQGGSLPVTYAGFDELRENPDMDGTQIDYTKEEGILLENNREYLFMAQVSNLTRGLETDKLKWSISSGDKNAATLKPSSSSYELKLTANKVGTFTVTAVSTLTKESVATFRITIYPYQSADDSTGEGGTAQAIPVDRYCEQAFFGKKDEEKKDKL